MDNRREGKNHGKYSWTDVSHYHAGGGDKQKSELKKVEEGKRVRIPPVLGEYCLIIKPILDCKVGERRKIIREAYFGQVVRFYPHLMEVRKFHNGKALSGKSSLERIPLVDVKKSESLVLLKVSEIPEFDLDNSGMDIDTLKEVVLSYMSLYPEKKESEEDLFKVDVSDYCVINSESKEAGIKRERYIGQVIYKHPNMIVIRECRYGRMEGGVIRQIIKDELLRGFVKIFKLQIPPEDNFTYDELEIEKFKKNNEKYCTEEVGDDIM